VKKRKGKGKKMSNKVKMLIITGLWLFMAVVFVVFNEKIFLTGDEIRLKVKPVDPSDPLRGQYVRLEFDISKVPLASYDKGGELSYDKTVYVKLVQNADGISVVDDVTRKKPGKGVFYIRGKAGYIRGWGEERYVLINYGIENFFTSQKEAKNLEKRLVKGGIARVKVDKNGHAKVIKIE